MKYINLKLISDILENLKDNNKLWIILANVEIKKKYNRPILGKMWLILLPIIQLIIIGPIYSMIFNREIESYLIYLGIGLVLWNFIVSTINDMAVVLIHSETYIIEMKLNISRFIFKVIYVNIYNLFFSFIIVFVIIIFKSELKITMLLSIFGLFLVIINLYMMGIIIAIVSIKFRDIPLLLNNIMNLLFLITPIFWNIRDINSNLSNILIINPIFHMISVVRSPLILENVSLFSYLYLGLFFIMLTFFSLLLVEKLKNKIIYYL